MIVPVQVTWTTGQIVTAAQLNANVRDAINFLLAPPMAMMRQSVAQSIANRVWSAINLDVEELDRDNAHSTASFTSRYSCNTPGWYHNDSTIGIAANATGMRALHMYVNGGAKPGRATWSAANGSEFSTGVTASGSYYLNTADFAEVYTYQSSGVALNTTTDALCAMTLRWVSN